MAKLDITTTDRFGKPILPREWFLLPFSVISEAIDKLKQGTLAEYRRESTTAQIVKVK